MLFYCSDILSTSRNTSLCTENCNLFTKIYMGNWTVGYGLYIDVLPKVPEINFFLHFTAINLQHQLHTDHFNTAVRGYNVQITRHSVSVGTF